MVLVKIFESPLDCKEIQPVHPKGDQSWVCIGRMMSKLKLQYFGHLLRRADSLEKTLMLGKIEGGRRKGREGNGNPLQYSCLVGCSPWGLKEWNTTEQLHFHFSLSCVGEGNGNPLQCSCLENPKDG